MNNKVNKKKLTKNELERIEILQKAEEVKGKQLEIDIASGIKVEDEYKKLLEKNIDDPILKFQMYYKGLNKLLKSQLPTGKDNEPLRRIIYDEKNILINRGNKKDEKGIRGSDGRMAYLEDLETAINIVIEWISSKGSYLDLYQSFWNKNEELKYGHQD